MKKTPLTEASRNEVEFELTAFEGEIPKDLSGFAYFNSPVGTVNNETPIPKYNPDGTYNKEYGQMIFNGDGMLFRFDMSNPGTIRVKTALLKTPCYHADEATKYGTEYNKKGICFKSAGMARTSLSLGSRNQINTSVNLFKLPGNKHNRVTVNFDAGRPFEIDPVTMELITPIGRNDEWEGEMPIFLDNTFPLHQSSAHPSFDPVTQEFFTVCFQKSFRTLILSDLFHAVLLEEKDKLLEVLQHAYHNIFKRKKHKTTEVVTVLKNINDHLVYHHEKGEEAPQYTQKHANAALQAEQVEIGGMENAVTLMRFTGKPNLEKWNLVDEQGKNIVIEQTMHQTALTKDYIVLVDTSLKFALDILINNPFPKHPALNRMLRWITTKTIEPTTPLYIIRRADLREGAKNVTARKLTVPLETVHFSLEYNNPNDLITMYTSHNSALCAAEWVRPYDTLATNPKQAVDPNTIGLFTCGEMDINRISKIVMNANTTEIQDAIYVHDKGFDGDDVNNITRAHTWAVGLNTFRDELSADIPNTSIPYIFWQFYGLDKRLLTNFIKELYEDYANRIISVEKVLEYTENGVPFCLSRLNTATMKFDDFYLFEMNQNLRSLQFVPRSENSSNPHPEYALNGYILCTMVNGNKDFSGDEYSREIWIFDAANLKQGPVSKCTHNDLSFACTIHSVWADDCMPSPKDYVVNIVADYTQVVNSFKSKNKRKEMLAFLEDTVFPHYK